MLLKGGLFIFFLNAFIFTFRDTWGTARTSEIQSKLVFLLGMPQDSKLQPILEQENKEYHDIVQGGFYDTYRNLSYKNIMGKLWASQFCSQAEFVVKTDDDVFVDLYEVFALTRKYMNTSHFKKDSFLLCPVWINMQIERDPASKWFVPYDTIEKRKGLDVYIKYCSGWIYITTPGTAGLLAEVAKTTKFFWIDDAWVTGYLADILGIEHQDMMKYFTANAEALLLQKTLQSPETHNKDYISGPMMRNKELSYTLTEKAKWCFEHNCLNDIYLYENLKNMN